jgi:hypothetical protein
VTTPAFQLPTEEEEVEELESVLPGKRGRVPSPTVGEGGYDPPHFDAPLGVLYPTQRAGCFTVSRPAAYVAPRADCACQGTGWGPRVPLVIVGLKLVAFRQVPCACITDTSTEGIA